MDSPSSDLYLAPEYLQSPSSCHSNFSYSLTDQADSSNTSNSNSSIQIRDSSYENDLEKCIPSPSQQVPNPGTTTVYESSLNSPPIIEEFDFDDMKIDQEQSPFIGKDDPLLGAPLFWDDFTIVDDTYHLSTDI